MADKTKKIGKRNTTAMIGIKVNYAKTKLDAAKHVVTLINTTEQ
jgi:hypothetical protein